MNYNEFYLIGAKKRGICCEEALSTFDICLGFYSVTEILVYNKRRCHIFEKYTGALMEISSILNPSQL